MKTYLQGVFERLTQSQRQQQLAQSPKYVRKRKRFRTVTWRYRKSIGSFGSCVYLINQILGAGLVSIPNVLRSAGWLPSFVVNGFVCVVSSLCTLMLIRAMTMIPGNQNFEQRFEFSAVLKYYFPRRWALLVEAAYHIGVQCGNIVCIIVVSQALDQILLVGLGRTFAMQIWPRPEGTSSSTFFVSFGSHEVQRLYSGSLFEDSNGAIFAVTLGYLITAIFVLRLSMMNLEENMKVQFISFCVVMVVVLQLCTAAFRRIAAATGDHHHDDEPAEEDAVQSPGLLGLCKFGALLTTFLDGYQYVVSTPPWANEITDDVPVSEVVWKSSLFACVVYYVFGVVMATAFPADSQAGNNILHQLLVSSHIRTGDVAGILTVLSIYTFILLAVLPGVVTTNISTKYNLTNSNVFSPSWSFIVACVGPFLVSWAFACELLADVLGWVSLWAGLICNFIAPSSLYLLACTSAKLATRNPGSYRPPESAGHASSRQPISSLKSRLAPSLNIPVEGITAGGAGGAKYGEKVKEVQRALQDWLTDFAQKKGTDEDVALLAMWSRSNLDDDDEDFEGHSERTDYEELDEWNSLDDQQQQQRWVHRESTVDSDKEPGQDAATELELSSKVQGDDEAPVDAVSDGLPEAATEPNAEGISSNHAQPINRSRMQSAFWRRSKSMVDLGDDRDASNASKLSVSCSTTWESSVTTQEASPSHSTEADLSPSTPRREDAAQPQTSGPSETSSPPPPTPCPVSELPTKLPRQSCLSNRKSAKSRRCARFAAEPTQRELSPSPPSTPSSSRTSGMEDSYDVDHDPHTGELMHIRVHVFPEGFLRKQHLRVTYCMLAVLLVTTTVGFAVDVFNRL